jgi:hypothetical protein
MGLIAITDMYRVMHKMSEINRQSRGWATVEMVTVPLAYDGRRPANLRSESCVVGPQVSLFVMSVPLSQQKAVGTEVIQNLFLFLQRTFSCVVNLKQTVRFLSNTASK